MVLAELGGRISHALQQMSNATIIDENVLKECLKEISRALLRADVHVKMVSDMQINIKKIIRLDDLAAGHNKRKIIQQVLGKPQHAQSMHITIKKKGWKPALVCADTFRAGAFDQLKQNASKAKIPFYGSYMESDPVKIAVEGVERFKKENFDLIIVDTSGRHKQEAALFEEMHQVSEATKPDLVIFVMYSSIGQAALDKAQAFKQSIAVGAVIVTKMDGHAKGGGALSMGDWSGFMDKIHEVVPMDQQAELMQKLSEGNFTPRLMYEQYQNMLKMGPIDQVFSMIPGFGQQLMPKGREKESQLRVKRFMTIMDSMTNGELDSSNPKLMNDSRIMHIAQGAGRPKEEVMEMLEYKHLAKIWSNVKGLKIPKNGEMNALSQNMNAQHMSKVLPPHMLKKIGGMGGLQNMMKHMGSKEMRGMFGGER